MRSVKIIISNVHKLIGLLNNPEYMDILAQHIKNKGYHQETPTLGKGTIINKKYYLIHIL